ncbi:hypothetical protein PR202_gb26811 [Eleusine coracana subsp. coracana]|uniref:Pectinesterase inhibitor domain-containing protein n=1 Tax=Eleusine coracana subsp. coracana TaxID=191504 RepID=A0AAV5FSG6_ELECO|nr:hypothetical protein QOZ80_1BG0054060 [Eleusine coracana subsp. coracana]GJN37819.1 hypothetical protein PR202_gb26811 [Eleusine coracana subsp. coracana]
MAGRRHHALLVLAAVMATSCSLVAAHLMPRGQEQEEEMPVIPDMMMRPKSLPVPPVPTRTVAEICRGTSFPELCTATAGKQAARYGTVDVLTVLQMEVDALGERTKAARARVDREAAAATPAGRKALHQCNSFYGDVMDNLDACRRAIGHKDAVTIRSTMSMVAQDLQFCDEEFRKAGEKNPLQQFDQSLGNMSEICRSLSNMIVVD